MSSYHYRSPVRHFRSPVRHFRSIVRLAAVCLTASLLSCSTTPPAPVIDTGGPDTTVVRDAEKLFAEGSFSEAATLWQQRAVSATPGQASHLRVLAADAWMLGGQPEAARNLLEWIESSELDANDQSRLNLVLADMALNNQRFDEALASLRQAAINLPAESQSRFNSLESRLGMALQQPGSQYIARAAGIAESMLQYQPVTALAILKALEPVNSAELAVRSANPQGGQKLNGWLDLTLVIRQHLVNPRELDSAVVAWKARYPDHMLSETEALDLWLLYRQQFSRPSRVAVLLPAEGRLQAAGNAIRDGLLSAYLAEPGGTELKFYATSDNPQSAVAAYFQAVDEGAKLVIGPLQADSVKAVSGLAGLGTPLLALNRLPDSLEIPDELARQVFGMSLSQEEEAEAVGLHIATRGLYRAMILAPESSWGERMVAAFTRGFIQEGLADVVPASAIDLVDDDPENDHVPEIVASVRYGQKENDHSPVLERVLQIDESKARKARLETTVQIPLSFEPVRRNDIDVIFMVADSTQARLLRPQLRFHDAGKIPVFATGRIYTGQPDRIRNRDLNGIRFPATTWLLDHSRKADLPQLDSIRAGNFASLYALGKDAWNILPWLELMKIDPDFDFAGNIGLLSIDPDNTLRREPAWAIFARGLPVQMVDSGTKP